MVTIVGTVTANLITILVIAAYRLFVATNNLEIIPPRDMPRPLRWLVSNPPLWLWFEIPAGLVVFGFMVWSQLQKARKDRSLVFLGFAGCGLLVYLLIVIGLASGTR
jgi:hypothetical protein